MKNWIKPSKVDWSNTDWGDLQSECVKRNRDRFDREAQNEKPPESRTAILIRTYTGKEYSEDDKRVLRAMVTELSLHSGGQYEVFLLVHVKDDTLEIENQDVYNQVVQDSVPEEFWGITRLWNIETARYPYPYLSPDVVKYVLPRSVEIRDCC